MEFYNVSCMKGESFRLALRFTYPSGTAYDLTGMSGYAQIRTDPNHGDLLADLGVSISGESGSVILTLAAEKTFQFEPGVYAWDFCLKDADGAVTYFVGGQFRVKPAVTESALEESAGA